MDLSIVQDGTIGDDLVVKPLPSRIRTQIAEGNLDTAESFATATYANPFDVEEEIFVETETRHTNETDDYEFLDEDDKFNDPDVVGGNFNGLRRRSRNQNRNRNRKRNRREVRSDFHVVFKRKDSNLVHDSDYRKL